MEKTLARAIYRLMEIGKEYTTSDLFRLIEDDYYKYVPADMHPFAENGKPVNSVISSEMWNVVKAGYAKTFKKEQNLAMVRGVRFGSNPTRFQSYTFRYWVRVK